MSAGLFAACCPDCGAELHIDESGNGTCTTCANTYLNRLGYLIPVEVPIDEIPAQLVFGEGPGTSDAVSEASMSMGGA